MRARNVVTVLLVVLGLFAAPLALAGHARGKDRPQQETTTATTASTALGEDAATLVVLVNATGADGSFAFAAEGGDEIPSSFTLGTRNGTARIAFGGLRPDHEYTLRALVPAGWNLTRASCNDGSAPASFRIPANGTLTCGFDHERFGTLVVRVDPAGADGLFPFHVSNHTTAGLPGSFNVTTANGTGQRAFTVQPLANLTLLPSVPPGWNLTSAACGDGRPASDLSVGRNETVTCAFGYERLNTLVVKLATRGGDLTLPFQPTGGGGLPASFNLSTTGGAATLAFVDLDTDRAYGLQPLVPAGWTLTGSHCDAGTLDSVHLAAGRTATCQLNLTRLATLTLVVLSRGGDATFTLAATGPSLPATLHVTTVNGTATATHLLAPDAAHALAPVPPPGWRLAASACTPGTPANLTPAPGGLVTCTFELSRLGEVRGVAWHDRDRDGARDAGEEGIQGWTVWLDADGDAVRDADERAVATDASGAYAFSDLAPGLHLLREQVPAGWVATTPTHLPVSLAEAAFSAGHDFGALQPGGGHAPPPASGPGQGGSAGIGHWRNWDNHYAREQVDAWVRALSASSAWLMPAGYAEDAGGVTKLVGDATKQCNRTFGHHGCAQKKLEAHLLALRLNVQSGRLEPATSAGLPEGSEASRYLGIGPGATVQQLLDAIEAKVGSKPTRDQLQAMRAAVERAHGGGD